MVRRLDSVLGRPAGAPTSEARALNVLDALKYGNNLGFACGVPGVQARHWGRVLVLEQSVAETDPSPMERLASALAGIETVMEMAVTCDDAGLGLLLGFSGEAELRRARLLLAPGTVIDVVPAPVLPVGHVVGVTHRPQSTTSEGFGSRQAEVLLDRLEGIPGPWTLFWHCESAAMTDVLGTVHGLDALAEEAASNLNLTRQLTDTATSTSVSHRWKRVEEWTQVIAKLLAQGSGTGLWSVDTWAGAEDAPTARLLAGALHAAVPSDQGRWYETLDFEEPEADGPPPTSVLTSRDIGNLLRPPRSGRPGLAVRPAFPPGRRPARGTTALTLGTYLGTDATATISVEDLEGHAFVTGTTGSGKTTTVHRLLAELWNRHRVPFLVLDPVKDDYSGAASHFRGGIQVLRGADIHLNLLEAWPGEDVRAHIVQVASAFRGAFSMPSPTPYVVTQLFDRVAMLRSGGAGMSLFDVRDMVPDLISSLGYAPEQESNIRAALMTRLNLLLAPTRAHRFSWSNSSMVTELFTRPTVVTLSDLTDEEERSFVVLLLSLATWARARNRKGARGVEHVLVLEEAHRILPEVDDRGVDPEIGSAKQVSAGMLASMMAEVRSFGEQIVVVDQSPSKVSGDVSRNTNLKIAHRVVHPEDQVQVAGMLGLPREDAALLGQLDRGHVVLTTRTEPSAQTLGIDSLQGEQSWPGARTTTVGPPPAAWPCGTTHPEAHYRAWQLGPRSAHPMSLFLAGMLWGEGDGRKLREHVYRELLAVGDGDQAITDCLAWSGLRQLGARRRMLGPASGPNSAESQLDSLYALWSGRLPVIRTTAEGIVATSSPHVAPAGSTPLSWEEQAIADTLLQAEPRNGLRLLRTAAWRAELPDLVDHLRARTSSLEPMMGAGARTLMRVLVTAAVSAANLTSDVTDHLLTRVGLVDIPTTRKRGSTT